MLLKMLENTVSCAINREQTPKCDVTQSHPSSLILYNNSLSSPFSLVMLNDILVCFLYSHLHVFTHNPCSTV